MQPVHITALRHSAFYSPLLVTIAGGFLEQEGLTPHYRPLAHGEQLDEQLRRGHFHLAQAAVATSFKTLEAGRRCDIVHFASINQRDGFFIAARGESTQFDWHELARREVLVDHLFQPLAMLRYALHLKGIDYNQLKVIDAGSVEAMDSAFRAGRGDFIHQQGPAPQQLEHDGIARVVAAVGDVIGPVAFSSLCATRDWLGSDMAGAFMRAYRKGLAQAAQASPRELSGLVAGFFPLITRPVLTRTIDTYQRLGCWSSDPQISAAACARLQDVFLHSGLISRRHKLDECVCAPPQ